MKSPKPQAAPRSASPKRKLDQDMHIEVVLALALERVREYQEANNPRADEWGKIVERIRPLLEAAPEMVELLGRIIAFGGQREITGSDAVDWISNVVAQQAKAIIRKAQPPRQSDK